MLDDFVHILSEEVYSADEMNDELGRRLDQLSGLGMIAKIPIPEISDMVVTGNSLIIVTPERSYTINPTDKVAYKKRISDRETDKLYKLGGTVNRAGIKEGSKFGPYLMVQQNFMVSIHKCRPLLVMLKNIEYLYVGVN